MHIGMTECHIPFSGHCDVDSNLVFKIILYEAYLIFFEVGIPNLVYECILAWRCVTYHFIGHCDLDL